MITNTNTTYFVLYPDGTQAFANLDEATNWALENVTDFYGETFEIYKGEQIAEVYLPDPKPEIEWKQKPEEKAPAAPEQPKKSGLEAAQDEMNKLRKALEDAGIEWKDDSSIFAGITRTKFTNKLGNPCSVICGEFTYGGNFGLLETMPPVDPSYDEDEVQGWLSADEIINAWVRS